MGWKIFWEKYFQSYRFKNYVSDTVAPTAGNAKFSKDLPNGGTMKNVDTKKNNIKKIIEH